LCLLHGIQGRIRCEEEDANPGSEDDLCQKSLRRLHGSDPDEHGRGENEANDGAGSGADETQDELNVWNEEGNDEAGAHNEHSEEAEFPIWNVVGGQVVETLVRNLRKKPNQPNMNPLFFK